MFRGAASTLLLKIIGEMAVFLAIIAATRMFSLEMSGLFILLQSNLFLFGTIATLGLGTAYHRYVPPYLAQGRTDDIRALIRAVNKSALLAISGSIAAFLVYQAFGPQDRLAPVYQALFAASIGFWALVVLQRHLLRAMRQIFWSEVSYQLIRPIGAIAVLVVGARYLSPVTAIFLALFVPLAFGVVHDIWRLRPLVGGLRGPASVDAPEWRDASRAYTVVMLGRIVLQRLDLLLVGAILGLEAAAIYGVAARISLLVVFVVDPIDSVFRPRASLHIATGEDAWLRRDIVQAGLWIAAASLLTGVAIIALPGLWLNLFGPAFDPDTSVILLWLSVLGRFISANSSISQTLLLMAGHERMQAMLSAGIALVLYPVAAVWATLTFGLIGAAVAVVAARLAQACANIIAARVLTGHWGLVAPRPGNLATAFGGR
ncbi:MAG: lipopolysaccharide biosynthesis protein [Paracoccaceae bacterium]